MNKERLSTERKYKKVPNRGSTADYMKQRVSELEERALYSSNQQ